LSNSHWALIVIFPKAFKVRLCWLQVSAAIWCQAYLYTSRSVYV
jgi:hypothetical protein